MSRAAGGVAVVGPDGPDPVGSAAPHPEAPSRGAADHVTPVRATRRVTAFLPGAPVVDPAGGENWEGTGVLPGLPCPADEAVDRAVEVVRRAPAAASPPSGAGAPLTPGASSRSRTAG